MLAVGIDIGGTKIAGALVDAEGSLIKKIHRPSPAQDAQTMADTVADMVRELAVGTDVTAVGVAAAGFIDRDQSTVYYAPNIAWRNEPLKAELEKRLPYQVLIENDANAAGWAEYRFGAGRLVRDMTLLTIGTGLGGAIIAGGQLFRGGFGSAAELGHLKVETNGLLCGCGQHGCIEQYASGRALLRHAEAVANDPERAGGLASVRDADGNITPEDLKRLLEAGDPGAMQALVELGTWLGRACASIAAILDPELFVFGGGVSVAGEALIAPIRAAYRENLSARGFHPEADFRVAELLNDAGVVGVADLARLHAESGM